ncbi:MAG: chemotaxis protein CheW [Proteobacteria bacterium]|nr:chemotaxis protein CheW [Pseudomonadota bacterium]
MRDDKDKEGAALGRDPLDEAGREEWDSIWKIPDGESSPGAPPPTPAGKQETGKSPGPPVEKEPGAPRPAEPPPPAQPKSEPVRTKTPARAAAKPATATEPQPPPGRVAAPAKSKRTSTAGLAADRGGAKAEGPNLLELSPGDVLQAVGFQVTDEHFCVPLEKTQEIIRYKEPSAVPDSQSFVEGIINLRGKVIPIISLRKRFGIAEVDPTRRTRIVILHVSGAGVVGLIVDSVSEVIRITADNLMDTSTFSSIHIEYINGLCQVGDRLHIILDADRLLSSAEKENIVSEGLAEG